MFMALFLVVIGWAGTPGLQAATAEGDAIQARYEVDLVGKSRVIFALPPGPRTIQTFRWVPAPNSSESWKSARLRFVWDGDDPEDAGVDVPLARFVRPDDERPTQFVNQYAMPYRRLGRLVLDAEGSVRGSLRLETVPKAASLDTRGYLRAKLQAEINGTEQDALSHSENVPENSEDESGPSVRYWYDRNPGPFASRR